MNVSIGSVEASHSFSHDKTYSGRNIPSPDYGHMRSHDYEICGICTRSAQFSIVGPGSAVVRAGMKTPRMLARRRATGSDHSKLGRYGERYGMAEKRRRELQLSALE